MSPDTLINALVWTLLNSLWLGLIVFIAAAIVVLATRHVRAAIRYNLLLALCFVFFGSTLMVFLQAPGTNDTGTGSELAAMAAAADGANSGSFMNTLVQLINRNADIIIYLWLIIFILRLLRLYQSVVYLQVLRRKAEGLPQEILDMVKRLAAALHIKGEITVVQSASVLLPSVIGFFKPVIFLPLGMINQLSAAEMEAIILHELAHIKRNDYLVNLFQCLLDAVFFFNPFYLWISAQLRQAREACCDDMVLEQTGDKRVYINSILAFREIQPVPAAALHITGSSNVLLERLKRIWTGRSFTLSGIEKVVLVVSVIAACAIIYYRGMSEAEAAPVTVMIPAPVKEPAILSQDKTPSARGLTVQRTTEIPKRLKARKPILKKAPGSTDVTYTIRDTTTAGKPMNLSVTVPSNVAAASPAPMFRVVKPGSLVDSSIKLIRNVRTEDLIPEY